MTKLDEDDQQKIIVISCRDLFAKSRQIMIFHATDFSFLTTL
ncbi:MAG: hypothetical protein BWX44_01029 [Spirochaetes bacterium ADurb.Bin001]|jgi:hypothetical protein|nr:MAG: hypothetical protein BWX44_01029 [Spirochaetes bacterium ADurb.Bin001]